MGSLLMGYDLMIVADMPTEAEHKSGESFTSFKYDIMKKIMDKVVGYSMDKCYCTVLCKTIPEGMKYLADKEIKDSTPGLLEEIRKVNPKAIITLGEAPFKALTGEVGSIRKSGELFAVKIDDELISLVPTYTPGYAHRNRDSKALLEKYAKSIHRAVFIAEGGSIDLDLTKTTLCTTLEQVEQVARYCQDTGVACIDLETTGLDLRTDKITVVSITFQPGSSWVVPIDHFNSPFSSEEKQKALDILDKQIFKNPNIRKLGWNFKFDLHFLRKYNTELVAPYEDILIKHQLLDENISHSLKKVAPEYYPEIENYEYKVKKFKWDEVPLDILADYAGVDTDITFRLDIHLTKELLELPELYRLYRNLSTPTTSWTYDAEKRGMHINRSFLNECIEDLTKRVAEEELKLHTIPAVKAFEKAERARVHQDLINELEDKLEKARGRAKGGSNRITENYETRIRNIKTGAEVVYEGINFKSTVQLQDLLYRSTDGYDFKMPWVKNKGGYYPSTQKDFLNDLQDPSGFVDGLIFHRRLAKLLSVYFVGIMERLYPDDTIHAEFLVWGTKTGRLSCKNPNLMNIPRKGNDEVSEYAKKVKELFIAPPGYVIMQADYSQAELRIAAELAREDMMIATYNAGGDIHSLTAAKMMGLEMEAFMELPKTERADWRFKAKAANFGLLYGMQVESYQEYSKNEYGVILTIEEAVQNRKAYFELYSKLQKWHQRAIRGAENAGYVTTLFGRRRRLENILNMDDYIKSIDDRSAINSPVQGTAGEFTLFAGALLRDRLLASKSGSVIINCVHDSIMLYVPVEEVDSIAKLVYDTMKNLPIKEYFDIELNYVSMEVDVEVGPTWGNLEPLEI